MHCFLGNIYIISLVAIINKLMLLLCGFSVNDIFTVFDINQDFQRFKAKKIFFDITRPIIGRSLRIVCRQFCIESL